MPRGAGLFLQREVVCFAFGEVRVVRRGFRARRCGGVFHPGSVVWLSWRIG